MSGALLLTARIAATLGGGYAAIVSGVALLSALATMFGMQRSEAVLLMSMLGFVAFLLVILWGFAERRVWRVAVVLAGAAALGHLGAVVLVRMGSPA